MTTRLSSIFKHFLRGSNQKVTNFFILHGIFRVFWPSKILRAIKGGHCVVFSFVHISGTNKDILMEFCTHIPCYIKVIFTRFQVNRVFRNEIVIKRKKKWPMVTYDPKHVQHTGRGVMSLFFLLCQDTSECNKHNFNTLFDVFQFFWEESKFNDFSCSYVVRLF